MTAPEPIVAEQTNDVVWRQGPVRLKRYRPLPDTPRQHPLPVVLVPSIINRPYILDLRPGQSLVEHFLQHGLDVYLVDWGEPGPADSHLGLEDYAYRLLRKILRTARQLSAAPQAHLLGYCLGGTFSLIGASRLPHIRSVLALTTPVDLTDPGSMGVLTDDRLLDLSRLAAAFPVVPAPMLWSAFQSLDPTGNSRKQRTFAERHEDQEFVRRFLAQETWLSDPVPMTARAVTDIVQRLYRDNGLVNKTLTLAGRPVDLAQGSAPVLNLMAQGDTIVPATASHAIERLWGGLVETVEFRGGHIGVTVGSRAPQHMWATATEWLTSLQD